MLLAILPRAVVFPPIGPVKDTYTVFLVIDILSFVFAAVSPLGSPLAMHLVVLPFAFVLAVFAPHIDSCIVTKVPRP